MAHNPAKKKQKTSIWEWLWVAVIALFLGGCIETGPSFKNHGKEGDAACAKILDYAVIVHVNAWGTPSSDMFWDTIPPGYVDTITSRVQRVKKGDADGNWNTGLDYNAGSPLDDALSFTVVRYHEVLHGAVTSPAQVAEDCSRVIGTGTLEIRGKKK